MLPKKCWKKIDPFSAKGGGPSRKGWVEVIAELGCDHFATSGRVLLEWCLMGHIIKRLQCHKK